MSRKRKGKCRKCGGRIFADGCRLCPLFAQGQQNGYANMPGCWPQNMGLSLGVHPTQVEKARARAKRHGISVEYTRNGDVIVPDRTERKKLLRLEGRIDKNSFTGY